MNIRPCRPYRAVDAGRTVIEMPDGRSRFKLYYVSITGRDDPARYEWERSDFGKAAFEDRFRTSGLEGLGFVTAFPHITKVFRFAPEMETVLFVRAFETRTLAPLTLDRGDGWVEFACLAEAVIAADEYRLWAEAADAAAYGRGWSDFRDTPVRFQDKLLRYWGAAAGAGRSGGGKKC